MQNFADIPIFNQLSLKTQSQKNTIQPDLTTETTKTRTF